MKIKNKEWQKVTKMTKIKDVYQEYLKRIENTSIEKSSFDILFEKPFDEYAKGIQTSEEKIDLVHSKLKSMYREQKEFVDSLNKNGENNHS